MRISVNEEPKDHEDYIVEAPYPEAGAAADYHLICSDLADVTVFSQAILKRLSDYSENDIPAELLAEIHAFWVAAVIKYARCFNSGSRSRLDPSIYSAFSGAKEAHDYFMALRNQYIAHPDNFFEDSRVVVRLTSKVNPEKAVLNVAVFSYRQVNSSRENLQTLINLTAKAQAAATQHFEAIRDIIMKKSIQDIEMLYSLPYASLTIPGLDKLKEPRKRQRGIPQS